MGTSGRKAGTVLTTSAPRTVCSFIASYSTGVRPAGLSRMASSIPILPMSCSSVPMPISSTSLLDICRCSASKRE